MRYTLYSRFQWTCISPKFRLMDLKHTHTHKVRILKPKTTHTMRKADKANNSDKLRKNNNNNWRNHANTAHSKRHIILLILYHIYYICMCIKALENFLQHFTFGNFGRFVLECAHQLANHIFFLCLNFLSIYFRYEGTIFTLIYKSNVCHLFSMCGDIT